MLVPGPAQALVTSPIPGEVPKPINTQSHIQLNEYISEMLRTCCKYNSVHIGPIVNKLVRHMKNMIPIQYYST